mgnify:CR=1 FL=1
MPAHPLGRRHGTVGVAHHQGEAGLAPQPLALAHLGQDAYFTLVQRCLPADSALRYKEPSEVPAEFTAPAIAMMPTNLLGSHNNFSSMMAISVWLSGLAAESLYFPRSFLQDLRFPFDPTFVDLQVEKMQELYYVAADGVYRAKVADKKVEPAVKVLALPRAVIVQIASGSR